MTIVRHGFSDGSWSYQNFGQQKNATGLLIDVQRSIFLDTSH